jgi:S1-C subfamily serine protease
MRLPILAGVLSFLFLGNAAWQAAEPPPAKPAAPAVLSKVSPETVDDLRALEKQVQAVVAKVLPATVAVSIGPAQGSGVLVKDGYVLTAGHVSGQPGRTVILHLSDGRKLKGKTLGRNGDIDSGMIQVLDKGTWPTAPLGNAAKLKKGQWVISIGHPGGYRANRTPVVRLGRVLAVTPNVILTDCTLVGGDSGGPLFDLDGNVVGIHSRIGLAITQNFHVPVDTYAATWDRLVRGDNWGGMAGFELVQSPGGKVVLEKRDRLTSEDSRDKVLKQAHHKVFTFKMSPASIYTLDMASKKVDCFLRIEDAAGKQLAADDDGAGNLDARIVFRPSKDDTYRIIATTFQPNQTGPFKLTIRQLDANDLLVQGNVPVFGALKMPRFVIPVLMKELRSSQGAIFVSGTVFDLAGKPAANKEVQFHWARGSTTLKTNDQGVVRLRLFKDKVADLVLNVPPEHKALVELTNADGKLRVFRFTPGPGKEKVPAPPGKVVFQSEGNITAADPFDKARATCRHKVHMFKLTGGMSYAIDLESTDFDAFLRIEDAGGKQLAEDDDSAGDFNSRVVLHPKMDQSIRIVITTCDPGQLGTYRLIVRELDKK